MQAAHLHDGACQRCGHRSSFDSAAAGRAVRKTGRLRIVARAGRLSSVRVRASGQRSWCVLWQSGVRAGAAGSVQPLPDLHCVRARARDVVFRLRCSIHPPGVLRQGPRPEPGGRPGGSRSARTRSRRFPSCPPAPGRISRPCCSTIAPRSCLRRQSHWSPRPGLSAEGGGGRCRPGARRPFAHHTPMGYYLDVVSDVVCPGPLPLQPINPNSPSKSPRLEGKLTCAAQPKHEPSSLWPQQRSRAAAAARPPPKHRSLLRPPEVRSFRLPPRNTPWKGSPAGTASRPLKGAVVPGYPGRVGHGGAGPRRHVAAERHRHR